MFATSPISFLCSDDDSAHSTEQEADGGEVGLEVVEVEPAELALFDGLLDIKGFRIIDPGSQNPKSNETMTTSNTESELVKYLGGHCSNDYEEMSQNCEEENPGTMQKYLNISPTSSVECQYSHNNSSINNGRCMSKNAIAARENRQKKKMHLSNLEETVTDLKHENLQLKNKVETMSNTIENLESEVQYLKGIIANQSTISKLLGSIQKTPGIRFHTSFSLDRNETKNSNFEKNLVSELEAKTNSRKRKSVPQETDSSEGKNEHIENICTISTRSSAKRVLLKQKVEPLQQKSSNFSLSASTILKTGTHNIQPSTNSKQTISQNSLFSSDKQVQVGDIENNNSVQSQTSGSGVCLHVANGSVSLEFCSTCAANASKIRKPQSCEKRQILRR